MLNREMHELRKGLDAADIEWRDDSKIVGDVFFERIKFNNKDGESCSVIFIDGFSYGHKAGLLESMPPVHNDIDDDVEGYLTAAEILDAWV